MAQNRVHFTIDLNGTAYTGVVKLNAATEKVCSICNKAESSFSRFGDTMVRVNNIFQLAQTAVSKVSNALEKVVSVGSDSELQKMNLTTLFEGNAQAAEAMYEKIAKYGKETPYDKAGLIDAQKTMMAFGISGEKAFEKLKQIGDIAMGDKQKMQSLALAFSQVSSAGKLSGQDLLQMANQGFNPLKIISEKTGESMASLRDKMSKGLFSVGMVEKAFAIATSEGGLFYNAINNAAGTTSGKLGALQDAVNETLAGIFERLKPYIDTAMVWATSAIDKVLPFIDALKGKIANLWEQIQNAITWVKNWSAVLIPLAVALTAFAVACNITRISLMAQDFWLNILIVKEKLVAVATALWSGAQAALNAIMSANPIALVIAAIAALVGIVILVVRKWDEWGETIKRIAGPLGGFIHLIESVVKNWNHFIETFKTDGIMAGLKEIGKVLLDAVLYPIERLLNGVAKIPGAGKYVGKWADDLRATRERLNPLVNVKTATEGTEQKVGASLGVNETLQETVNRKLTGKTSSPATTQTTTAVATGGTRNTEIHINIGDMIKQVVFNGTTAENKQEIERNFAECLYRVLGMAQASIG